MNLPAFFDEVPRLRVRDPLAEILGCAEGGVFEYSYGDAVRLAGHSCPTVAAAYWLTLKALAELYPGELPQRGGVGVEFRDHPRVGSTGVVASVVQLLTGAAGDGGFKGISGRYARVGLQRITADLPLSMRFTRLDNGTAVDAAADLTLPDAEQALAGLLERCVRGRCDAPALAELGVLWQRRVRHLLIDLAHDPGVFMIRPVERRATSAVSSRALAALP